MKAWLETSKLEKLAPVIERTAGGLPTIDQLIRADDDDDDEMDRKTKETANDGMEEEAEAEQHDRKLDDQVPGEAQAEAAPGGKGGKPGNNDFLAELKNAWLPDWDEYLDKLRLEMRGFNWQEEASRLWLLPREQRRETYRQWLLEVHHQARGQLPEIARLLERNADSRAALERDRKLEMLREMEVVGMTTTAVSKYQQLLKELRPEVVIVEEAAEVLEAHILTALHARTQHVILIGDHQQLRPSTAVYRLSKCFHLDVSLFERLIKNGADHVTLLQQRRMHPKISRLMRPLYPELRDHKSVSDYPEVMGVDARTFFLKHTNLEDDEGESHSKSNTFEANFIAALVSHLIQSGYDESQITVLSPYLGQVRTLKNKMRRDPNTMNVLITAVDNYQGEENDIIVISLVRSNRNRSMGFLAVENRINVALTRARHGMFIVGNADMLKGHSLWSQIIAELQTDRSIGERMPLIEKQSGGVFEVKSADDISVLLDDPLHRTGGEGENFRSDSGKGGRVVAERWANLGQDDKPEKGGKGWRGDRDRGPPERDRDRDRKGGGGNGAGHDDRSRGGKNNRDVRSEGKGRNGGKGEGRRDDDGERAVASPTDRNSGSGAAGPRRGGGGGGVAAAGSGSSDEAPERERAPPPAKLEADGSHEECDLLAPGADEGEVTAEAAKKAGKKKQKAGNKEVLMRWG